LCLVLVEVLVVVAVVEVAVRNRRFVVVVEGNYQEDLGLGRG
jgi:hypothetical protein